MSTQLTLPREYTDLLRNELTQRVAARKAEMGTQLCILGHHYQSDDVIQFADFTGDSLKLSQLAAEQKEAKYIVFCGVHFMAESADVLSSDEQVVCLPNLRAGCAMADMADATDVAAAIEEVSAMGGGRVVPISYVNSTAAIKALTARAGGACCTSSNVRNVFAWALRRQAEGGAGADKIFCVPDQHLGRNTAMAMGCDESACAVYDPALAGGGLSADDVARATFVLWKGHCYVHQLFRPEHVADARAACEGVTVIVHPECPRDVVAAADLSGSTEQIIRAVAAGSPGSKWAVGTEGNLVRRLARRHGDRLVRSLSPAPALCQQMARIDLHHLLWVLDHLAQGRVVNQVTVDKETATDAHVALERMIAIKAAQDVTRS